MSTFVPILQVVLWGLGIVHCLCAIGILAVWWWEKRKGHPGIGGAQEQAVVAAPVARPSGVRSPLVAAERLSALENQVAVLTKRVSTVYPLLSPEDVRKVVWMVVTEIAHEPGDAPAHLSSEKARRLV